MLSEAKFFFVTKSPKWRINPAPVSSTNVWKSATHISVMPFEPDTNFILLLAKQYKKSTSRITSTCLLLKYEKEKQRPIKCLLFADVNRFL